jgi:hypothetical protein
MCVFDLLPPAHPFPSSIMTGQQVVGYKSTLEGHETLSSSSPSKIRVLVQIFFASRTGGIELSRRVAAPALGERVASSWSFGGGREKEAPVKKEFPKKSNRVEREHQSKEVPNAKSASAAAFLHWICPCFAGANK